jgi:hypothetical protein
LTANGHLQISQQPIPGDWVLEQTNGSRIETGESAGVGTVLQRPGVNASTFCTQRDSGFRCLVVLQRITGVTMAAEGTVSCPDATTRTFAGDGFKLQFTRGFAIVTGSQEPCEPYVLSTGAHIVTNGDWEVSATTPEGEPLSVGVTLDGTLVVGKFSGDLTCPCIGR